MQKLTRGRPRLDPNIRLKIVQKKATYPDKGVDAIMGLLQKDGISPMPARATVAKIIQEWQSLPDEIRLRDMPFQWHRLEYARCPWEAGAWLCECQWVLEDARVRRLMVMVEVADNPQEAERQFRAEYKIPSDVEVRYPTSPQEIIEEAQRGGTFSIRWATWCWRVHLALPDLKAGRVLGIAQRYALEEQARDVLLEHPPMDVGDMDA